MYYMHSYHIWTGYAPQLTYYIVMCVFFTNYQKPFGYHITLPLAAQYAWIENVTFISRMGILMLPSVMQIRNLILNH